MFRLDVGWGFVHADIECQCDPEAAQSIFSNAALAAKTTLIPLNLTHQVLAMEEVRENVLKASDRKGLEDAPELAKNLRRLFWDLLNFFASSYRDKSDIKSGPPLHDPVAIAAILPDSEIFFDDGGGERWHIEVVTEGKHGSSRQTSGQLGRTLVSKATAGGVRIPRTLDVKRFWKLIYEALNLVEQTLMNQRE